MRYELKAGDKTAWDHDSTQKPRLKTGDKVLAKWDESLTDDGLPLWVACSDIDGEVVTNGLTNGKVYDVVKHGDSKYGLAIIDDMGRERKVSVLLYSTRVIKIHELSGYRVCDKMLCTVGIGETYTTGNVYQIKSLQDTGCICIESDFEGVTSFVDRITDDGFEIDLNKGTACLRRVKLPNQESNNTPATDTKVMFKPGDWVYRIANKIKVYKLVKTMDCMGLSEGYPVAAGTDSYTADGRFLQDDDHVPMLLPATEDSRKKLIAIWGEDAVPQLPLTGSELTKQLLKDQEYVACWLSDVSDDDARAEENIQLIEAYDTLFNVFLTGSNARWDYAVPVDIKTGEELDGAVL